MLQVPGAKDVAIELFSCSKSYNMTGWRLGFAVWPDELVDPVTRLCINDHSCVNAATQYAGIAALEGPQDAVHAMVAAFDERRRFGKIQQRVDAAGIVSRPRASRTLLIEVGAVPIFVRLLMSPNDDVREQAVWALGNIAGDSPPCRDLVLQVNPGHPLPAAAQTTADAELEWREHLRQRPAPRSQHYTDPRPHHSAGRKQDRSFSCVKPRRAFRDNRP